jgi:hypothetical protein
VTLKNRLQEKRPIFSDDPKIFGSWDWRQKMRTAIESSDLVVWAPHKSLKEAKSLFAPYSPKFQTVPCKEMMACGKATVSALYLSCPEQESTVENALLALRNCRVSKLLVYTPRHSSDFAFRLGTIVGPVAPTTVLGNCIITDRFHLPSTETAADSRRQLIYLRSLDFGCPRSYDLVNVEVREFTFNRCPSNRPDR